MIADEERLLIASKSNPLLDMKNEMTLYQQRMLTLYLGVIDPRKEETKKVTFTLTDFVQFLELKEVNPRKLHKLARESVGLGVDLYAIDERNNGEKKAISNRMCYVSIWKRFRVDKDERGEWIVELEAGDDILPYMFEVKSLGYTKICVKLALRLRSAISEKLYEQLVRYKDIGRITISPEELKRRLGIADKESYKSYNSLKTSLNHRWIKEINSETDIEVEIIGEERLRMRGRPVKSITFAIRKNKKFEEKMKEKDREIQRFYEKTTPIDVEMTPVDATADKQITLESYSLQERYGFSDAEAETIIRDKTKLGLSDERVREVIEYVDSQDPANRMGYIRAMLRKPEAKLEKITDAERTAARNPFNRFEQNEYDFSVLEEEILSNSTSAAYPEQEEEFEPEPEEAAEINPAVPSVYDESEPEPVITEPAPPQAEEREKAERKEKLPPEGLPKQGLPPYFIVIGSPDVQARLSAYETLGISGKKIQILTQDEYNTLKGK